MTSSARDRETDYDLLYSFWTELPLIKMVSEEVFQRISEHPIRAGMVHVLRHGIKESGRTRHALSLKELRDPVEEYVQEITKQMQSVKLTALYHHRDKLLEDDIIMEVATFLEGKRYTTYYGRTARAFIGDHSAGKETQKAQLLKTLILDFNPEMESDTVDSLLTGMIQQAKVTHNKVRSWVEDHVGVINRLDLDTLQLYALLVELDRCGPETESTVENIRDLINLE